MVKLLLHTVEICKTSFPTIRSRRSAGGTGEAEGDNEDVAGNSAREEESESMDGM